MFGCRSAQQLAAEDQLSAFIGTLWRFPLVYICIFAVRFFLILIFRPLFRLSRQDLSYKEILFATVAGLRGSVSLILAQAVVVDPATRADDVQSIVSPLIPCNHLVVHASCPACSPLLSADLLEGACEGSAVIL